MATVAGILETGLQPLSCADCKGIGGYRMNRLRSLLSYLLLCLIVCGCSGKKVRITGRLTHGGVPLKGGEREKIRVSFVPHGESRKKGSPPVVADVDQDEGTFEAVVRAGNYRIAVAQFTENLADRFNNAFGEENSPIIRDLQSDQELDLDLRELAK
jgi:hypothetical protein